MLKNQLRLMDVRLREVRLAKSHLAWAWQGEMATPLGALCLGTPLTTLLLTLTTVPSTGTGWEV